MTEFMVRAWISSSGLSAVRTADVPSETFDHISLSRLIAANDQVIVVKHDGTRLIYEAGEAIE